MRVILQMLGGIAGSAFFSTAGLLALDAFDRPFLQTCIGLGLIMVAGGVAWRSTQ